jgi:hypothetical protein
VLMMFVGFGIGISVVSLLLNYGKKIGSDTAGVAEAPSADIALEQK